MRAMCVWFPITRLKVTGRKYQRQLGNSPLTAQGRTPPWTIPPVGQQGQRKRVFYCCLPLEGKRLVFIIAFMSQCMRARTHTRQSAKSEKQANVQVMHMMHVCQRVGQHGCSSSWGLQREREYEDLHSCYFFHYSVSVGTTDQRMNVKEVKGGLR